MKKGLFLSLVSVAAVAMLAGCGNTIASSASSVKSSAASSSTAVSSAASSVKSSTATGVKDGIRVAYGVMDTNCVDRIELTVKNGVVAAASINETPYFMDELAKVDTAEVATQVIETIDVDVTAYGKTSTNHMAKYVKIDGKVFTGTKRDAVYKGEYVKYSSGDIADLIDYVSASAANAQWYYTALENHNVSIVKDEAGTAYDTAYTLGTIADYGSFFKADAASKYWNAAQYTKFTWKENIAKIEAAMVGKDLSTVITGTKATTSNKSDADYGHWYIGTTDTGATITSFNDYFALASTAFTGTSKIVAHYYPFIHGRAILIGRTEMDIGADNKISYIGFNETFFCTYIANLGTAEIAGIPSWSNTVTKAATSSTAATTTTTYYATYLKIAGKVFAGQKADTRTDVTINGVTDLSGELGIYSADGIADLVKYVIADEANAEWYYTAMRNNDISIVADAQGTALATAHSINFPGDPFKADANNAYGYHGTTLAFNWKKNMAALEAFFVGKIPTSLTVDDAKSADGYWTVGGVSTGATLTECKQYFVFAAKAYSYFNI